MKNSSDGAESGRPSAPGDADAAPFGRIAIFFCRSLRPTRFVSFRFVSLGLFRFRFVFVCFFFRPRCWRFPLAAPPPAAPTASGTSQ